MLLNLDTKQSQKLALRGLIAVFVLAFGLRFWGLGRFNVLVFDEVYYAKFANDYLTNTPFYNSHPPLSQYLIAIGIWLGDKLPFGRDNLNTLTGSLHSTFSYRWMNALFGSLIPPLVAAIAYQLNRRLSFALLAALFISLDGLYLVDSRYALNNIYLVFFGLLGQLLVLIASDRPSNREQLLWTLGAAISFGASIACKWNGLSFPIAMYLVLAIAKIISQLATSKDPERSGADDSILMKLARLCRGEIFLLLIIIPPLAYSLLWIPHLIQNPTPNFIEVQRSILNYHEQVGNGQQIHPYCSNWYTWPLNLRPLAYFFKEYQPNYYYDVHAMGNPLLWWLAFAGMSGSLWVVIRQLSRGWSVDPRSAFGNRIQMQTIGITTYLLVNYAVNFLPWAKVTRCLFIYHYMGAVLFAIVSLAWWVDLGLRSNSKILQIAGLTIIFGVAGAFIFWLPIYLGLPIEKTQLSLRLWNFWLFNWI